MLIIPALFIILALILELIGWFSSSFCDVYAETFFRTIPINTLGRFHSLFPFSVGEILIYLGVFLVIVWIAAAFALLFRKGKGFFKVYSKVLFWIIGLVSLIMVLNCFLLYHCSTFGERYPILEEPVYESDLEKAKAVIKLRNRLVEDALELSLQVSRDASFDAVYEGDMEAEAIASMKRLGERFDLLSGYYPSPKPFTWSAFFSQQDIMGYYFPFSMEANYNPLMKETHIPVTMCHELSHVKGFIFEDEANFIAYMACIESDDVFFRYSALLSVIAYVESDYQKVLTAAADSGEVELLELTKEDPEITDLIRYDRIFLSEEAKEYMEKYSIFSTKQVQKASQAFLDGNLKANGISIGTVSYSQVVKWLLAYYEE